MKGRALLACIAGAASFLLPSCSQHHVLRSSSLDFLYPSGADPVEAADVTLEIPVRVGLAFVPGGTGYGPSAEAISEDRRQALLGKIAEAFRERDVIASLDVIPSTYLTEGGGFENLDRLRAAFGIDLILLVSYELTQFTETTGTSLAYWTIIGAYIVRGEKNETRTMLEAVVYDIPSRALLFRAGGSSGTKGRSTPVGTDRALRLDAEQGFDLAAEDLIESLREALDAFEKHAATGTVRGIGTPAIRVTGSSGAPVAGGGAGAYGGAFGVPELILGMALACAAAVSSRRRRR